MHWKEDWEIIGGHPYSLLPSPKFLHGRVQSMVVRQLNKSLEQNGSCNCLVLFEQDWKIAADTVVRPDVMIICGDPQGDYVETPPLLILEVFSPSTRSKDRSLKFELYQEQGVRYYLMADYERHTLESFRLVDNRYRSIEEARFELQTGCVAHLDVPALWA